MVLADHGSGDIPRGIIGTAVNGTTQKIATQKEATPSFNSHTPFCAGKRWSGYNKNNARLRIVPRETSSVTVKQISITWVRARVRILPERLVCPSSREGANRGGVYGDPKWIVARERSTVASTGCPPVRCGVDDGVALKAQKRGQLRRIICILVNLTGP